MRCALRRTSTAVGFLHPCYACYRCAAILATTLALAAGLAAGGCSPNAVCKLAGPINDPSNYTLRRSIMTPASGSFASR